MLIKFRLNPFYAPEGDIGASASTEVVADPGTDEGASTDPFDSLSFAKGNDESEEVPKEDVGEEEKEPIETEEPTEEPKQEPVEEKRTSKQSPEVDAAYKRARVAEDRAAQAEKELNDHREAVRQETEKKAQEQFQDNLNNQWDAHIETAKKMRAAEYDEQVVTQWLEAQRISLKAQETNAALEQRVNKMEADNKRSEQERTRLQQEKSASEGRELLLREHKELKTKYGDLVPDAKDFDELITNYGPEVVSLISKGLNTEEAFKVVNFEKITKQEKSLTEKRTTANIVDRSKKTVETNKTEKKPEDTLTEGQKRFAKEFGVDPKEVAKRSNPNLFKKSRGVS